MCPLPEFDSNGNLPPGVHRASMEEIERRFAWNDVRRGLFAGLANAMANLRLAGVKRVWIAGSFTTSKECPSDVDGYWEPNRSLDMRLLDSVFLECPRAAMKKKYGVDFLIAGTVLLDDAKGRGVEGFFQEDRDGNPRGVVEIETG